jgi:hypothetical protein
VSDILIECYHELVSLSYFVAMCRRGIVQASKTQEHLALRARALRCLDEEPESLTEAEIASAEQFEFVAQNEISCGFSGLYGLAVVKVWSLLETTVDKIVASRLLDRSIWTSHPQIAQLKGHLVSFACLPAEDQAAFLVRSLSDAVGSRFHKGAGRFESVLKPVGLGGGIAEEVARIFVELQAVRNICVHNRGVVDERFVQACPWPGLKIGDRFGFAETGFDVYSAAAQWYLLELKGRMQRERGKDSAEITKLKIETLDLLTKRRRTPSMSGDN